MASTEVQDSLRRDRAMELSIESDKRGSITSEELVKRAGLIERYLKTGVI